MLVDVPVDAWKTYFRWDDPEFKREHAAQKVRGRSLQFPRPCASRCKRATALVGSAALARRTTISAKRWAPNTSRSSIRLRPRPVWMRLFLIFSLR
jgi:hypothetical protein